MLWNRDHRTMPSCSSRNALKGSTEVIDDDASLGKFLDQRLEPTGVARLKVKLHGQASQINRWASRAFSVRSI